MQQEQLLRNVISAKELMMGSTPEGADWCIKALHPSDPTTQVRGIPDMSAANTCLINYQVTASLGPRPGATGTWQFDATLLPHPVNLMAVQYTDSIGDDTTVFLNSQMAGTSIVAKTQWLVANAQQWRLAYAGVTITQDGPALADQGTIVCSQSPVLPLTFGASTPDYGTSAVTSLGKIEVYGAEDLPSYTASQALPNAYFDQSKKGLYVPLKLTKTCQAWRSQSDLVGVGVATNVGANGMYTYPLSPTFAWPHWPIEAAWMNPISGIFWDPHVALTSPMLNDVMAHISVRNVAVTTSFAFFFRLGLELRVHPTSTLAPQLTLAPRYDPRALETYFAVSRELKDGYEAKFNDLGKLWSVISGTIREVAPLVARLGPMGSALGTIGTGVAGFGDAVQRRRNRRRKRGTPLVVPQTTTTGTASRGQKASPSKALAVRKRS